MSFTPGAGTRFLLFSTTNPSSAGTTLPGPLSITGGTATANTPVLSATQTWNNAAVTFTGWQLNVTDTASNAASLLMDLQVGGVSQFNVDKNGFSVSKGGFRSINYPNILGFEVYWGASFPVANVTSTDGTGSVTVSGDGAFRFSNAGLSVSNPDLFIRRDAANTLAQRNGVNAQTLRVYRTFTDASNYERAMIQWSGAALQIGAQAAGTGALRELQLYGNDIFFHAGGAYRWYITSASGNFLPYIDNIHDIGGNSSRILNLFQGAGYHQMAEMTAPAAPAANSVRIYAEDNGSGKTRLMALFATGAAQQIAIEP